MSRVVAAVASVLPGPPRGRRHAELGRRGLGRVRAAAALAGTLSIAALPACVHKVPLVADPVGAYVSVGGERVGVAPMEVPFRTFGPRTVTVELTGYRAVALRLPLFLPRALEVRLVPEHGGAGSWDAEDVR